MERRWSVPIISALVALLAVVLVAPGLDPVTGAIPDNGTYYACLTKSTGAVKVINYPRKQCATGQRLIKWNAKGPAGPSGPQGPQGLQGAQGPQGSAGPADWNAIPNIPADFKDGVDNVGVAGVRLTRVLGTTRSIGGGGSFIAAESTPCPAGSKVTGGGAQTQNFSLRITMSYPDSAGSWYVQVVNTGANAGWMIPYAICMNVEPAGAFTTAKKGKVPASVTKALKKRSR